MKKVFFILMLSVGALFSNAQLPQIPEDIITDFGELDTTNALFSSTYQSRVLVKIPFSNNTPNNQRYLTISFRPSSQDSCIYRIVGFSSNKSIEEIKESATFGSGHTSIHYLNEGIKTIIEVQDNEIVDTTTNEMREYSLFGSGNMPCVKSCYKNTMSHMNVVEWAVCIAAVPECIATIFLVCEWDCIFN